MIAIAFAVVREENVLPLRLLLSPPLLATIVLTLLMLVRLSVSPASHYGSTKLELFVAENFAAIVAGVLVGRRRGTLRLWTGLQLVVSAAGAVVLVHGLAGGSLQASAAYANRYTISSDYNPILLGRDTARGLLLAAWILLVLGPLWLRMLALALAPVLAVAFMASGSRGPVLGLVIGMIVLLALSLRDTAGRRRAVLVLLAGVGAVLLVNQLVPGQDVHRALSVFFGSNSVDASNGRDTLWRLAWHGFVAHPLFGLGTGGFAALAPLEQYPHDLVLEVLSELGVVGGIVLAVFVVSSVTLLVRVWRRGARADRSDVALVGALLGAAFVNALLSGDLPTNDTLWLSAGLALGLAQRAAVAVGPDARLLRIGRRRVAEPGLRRTQATPPPGRRRWPGAAGPPAGFVRSPGAIVSPADGAAVSGLVHVAARPAATGWGIASVHVEHCGLDGTWRRVGTVRDAAYTVHGIRPDGSREHLAIVRSRRLAETLAAELRRDEPAFADAAVEPSKRRPWQLTETAILDWDTRELEPGRQRLRVVTADVAGARIESPEISVEVRPAPEAPAAALAPAHEHERREEEHGRLELLRTAERAREGAALRERLTGLEQRERELAAELADLRVVSEAAQREAGVLRRRLEEAASQAAARDAAAAAVAERARDLAHRSAELEARERKQAALEQRLDRRRRAAEREERRIEGLAADVDRGRHELEAGLTALRRREAGAEALRREHEARLEALERMQESLRARARALERRELPRKGADRRGGEASSPSTLRLWQLEHVVTARPHPDAFVQAEREAFVAYLRHFVDVDGVIPAFVLPSVEGLFGADPGGPA